MKKILLINASFFAFGALYAGTDTLKNHSGTTVLELGKYTNTGSWGFYAGHNSEEQEQFGEKYYLEDHAHVLGVVAHLNTSTGTVVNPNTEIDFRLWSEDPITGQPSGTTSLEDGHLRLGDANLGGASVVMFHNDVHVDDAFFVTMDLGDYAHDPLVDTVGLYYAAHGSRSASDIVDVPFRNVYHGHSHGAIEWKDFYKDGTTPTPIATHFALYPIVELEHVGIGTLTKNGLTVSSPYPNPASDILHFPFQLMSSASVQFQLIDLMGKVHFKESTALLQMGQHEKQFDISTLPKGTYILSVITSEGAIGLKVQKN